MIYRNDTIAIYESKKRGMLLAKRYFYRIKREARGKNKKTPAFLIKKEAFIIEKTPFVIDNSDII